MGGTLIIEIFIILQKKKSGPKIAEKGYSQNCSTMKFAEQNFLLPILSRNLYERYP
jgi:hypothetical protein